MIRVLIADDHKLMREGLKHILSQASDISVASEACNSVEVLNKSQKVKCDIILLDITFQDNNGLEILPKLKAKRPEIPVLILTMHPEERFAIRAFKTGASGYLTKDCAADELIEAIRTIAQGRKYISPTMAEKLAHLLEKDRMTPLHENLSTREFQVMCLLIAGKRIKDIGKELSLSEKTVSTYRSRIMEKMNMKSNVELVLYAIENNLCEPPG